MVGEIQRSNQGSPVSFCHVQVVVSLAMLGPPRGERVFEVQALNTPAKFSASLLAAARRISQ